MEGEWDSWQTGKQHFFTENNIHESSESKTQWLSLETGYQQFLEEHGVRAPGGPSFPGDDPRNDRRKDQPLEAIFDSNYWLL